MASSWFLELPMFARLVLFYSNIHIYIYSHPQTDCFVVSQLFNVARQVGRLKLGSKPAQLYVRLSIILLSQEANHVSSGIIRHYVVAFFWLHFCLTEYQSAQFIRRALHYARGCRKFLRQSDIYNIPYEFFAQALSDGLSLESVWQ